jgi:hypothetical protein
MIRNQRLFAAAEDSREQGNSKGRLTFFSASSAKLLAFWANDPTCSEDHTPGTDSRQQTTHRHRETSTVRLELLDSTKLHEDDHYNHHYNRHHQQPHPSCAHLGSELAAKCLGLPAAAR